MGEINGLIDRWAKDAQKKLGEHNWKGLQSNCMMLIVAAQADTRKLGQKITKPFWVLCGFAAPRILWYIGFIRWLVQKARH